MRVRLAAAVALALVAFGCLPDGAEADRGHYRIPAGHTLSAELEGSDGYSISIFSTGRRLSLWTEKDGVTTEYRVRDSFAGTDGMKARLPGLGSISVRFHPRGPLRHAPAPPGCDGPRPMVQR